MKELGRLRKENKRLSEVMDYQDKWVQFTSMKVKMRAYSDKQQLLTTLKRDREAIRAPYSGLEQVD